MRAVLLAVVVAGLIGCGKDAPQASTSTGPGTQPTAKKGISAEVEGKEWKMAQMVEHLKDKGVISSSNFEADRKIYQLRTASGSDAWLAAINPGTEADSDAKMKTDLNIDVQYYRWGLFTFIGEAKAVSEIRVYLAKQGEI